MPTFVGIDGEGLNREKGATQDYVLLAASDESYIQTLDRGGLPTVDCFDYLLDVAARNDGAILCGFFTSYDVNMILRDVPREQLAKLWVTNECTWRPPDSRDAIQYRIKYVQNRVFELSKGWWYWDEKRGRYGWHRMDGVVWWDVFQFFQASFVKSIREWGVCTPDEADAIEAMKAQRSTFDAAEMPQIRAYCFDECRMLVTLMERMSDALETAGINLTSWYGSGAIAAWLLKTHGIKKHVHHEDPTDPETDPILRAYFGGRIETFAVGINRVSTWNADIRSAYPAAIINLPSLKGRSWHHTNTYDPDIEYAVWHVGWMCHPHSRLTPFPFRHKKRIYWPHDGEGWYHACEVRAAMDVAESLGWHIEVFAGWVLDDAGERPFESWIPELYQRRADFKAAGLSAEKPLKLGLNSCYGKLAQSQASKPGLDPPFRSFYWAGYTTAWTRAQILRAAAHAARTKHNLLAIATDGLFTRERVPLTEGTALGLWEIKELEPGLALMQPGVYATPTSSVKRTRGFSAKPFNYHEMMIAWHRERFDATLEIPMSSFIGFGHALARNRLGGPRNIWRTWQTGNKVIKMGGTATKTPDIATDWTSELVWLHPPAAPVAISEPYTPRVKTLRALADAEIDASSLAEQPDFEENQFTY